MNRHLEQFCSLCRAMRLDRDAALENALRLFHELAFEGDEERLELINDATWIAQQPTTIDQMRDAVLERIELQRQVDA
jgi:hypothetical protein